LFGALHGSRPRMLDYLTGVGPKGFATPKLGEP
jgi:hypothetical protein